MRRVIEAGLLLAGGFVLHQIMPPLVVGMRPDTSLLMLFIIIMLYRDKKIVLISGLGAGMLTALTTTFPGGQVANMIDKPISAFSVLGLVLLTDYFNLSLKLQIGFIGIVGTIISGSVFLGTASLMVALPQSFSILFVSVVLPAALLNTGFLYVLYPLVSKIKQILSPAEFNSNEETV